MEDLKKENEKLREEIRRITAPNLKTQFPIVFHPNNLRDPEIGPMVQAQLAAGTALLSEPMCVECGGYRDRIASAREAILRLLVFAETADD